MLPLCRYINTVYLSPLASKVSSFINRRGNSGEFVNSKNGYFAVSQTHDDRSHPAAEAQNGPNAIHVRMDSCIDVTASLDSQREILLRVAPQHDHYTTDARGGGQRCDSYTFPCVPLACTIMFGLLEVLNE